MAALTFTVPVTIDGAGATAVGVRLVIVNLRGDPAPTPPTTGQIWPRSNGPLR